MEAYASQCIIFFDRFGNSSKSTLAKLDIIVSILTEVIFANVVKDSLI